MTGPNARLVAALGTLHLNYIDSGYGDPVQHLEAADACVRELAALDPDSFNLAFLRGWLQFHHGETFAAVNSLSRARLLEPNNADVVAILCYTLILAGQDDRARDAAQCGIALDPLTPLFQCMPGFCELMAGRPAAAIPPYRRFLEIDPNNPAAHFFLAWVLCEADEREEAMTVASALAERFAGSPFGQMGLAFTHALRGERNAGLAVMRDGLVALTRHSEMFARLIASVLTMLGDEEGAIDALEDSVRLGNCHYPYYAHRATVVGALRHNPRFQQLLEVIRERWELGRAAMGDAAA